VSYLGYENKKIIVKSEKNSASIVYDVKLKNEEVVMLGEVATNNVYKSKRTLFQKIKSYFTND
jgi:hypothetical protein